MREEQRLHDPLLRKKVEKCALCKRCSVLSLSTFVWLLHSFGTSFTRLSVDNGGRIERGRRSLRRETEKVRGNCETVFTSQPEV